MSRLLIQNKSKEYQLCSEEMRKAWIALASKDQLTNTAQSNQLNQLLTNDSKLFASNIF
jgi:hypothetical protein